MGNCSSTGSKFNQSRFFKATILDSDCSIGSSGKELGYGNLEVTIHELVLHQKGVESIRWLHCRIVRFTSKGDIFILESMSADGLQKEKRFFLVKGANHLCKRLQDVQAVLDKKAKILTGMSRSDDGAAQFTKEKIGAFDCHSRMMSHPELDLAVNHCHHSHHPQFPLPNHPSYYYHHYGQYQVPHYAMGPYGPPQGFHNGLRDRMMDQWSNLPGHGMPSWQGPEERHYPTLPHPIHEEASQKENIRQKVSLALKKNSVGTNSAASVKRKFDALDLDTSNWMMRTVMEDDVPYDC